MKFSRLWLLFGVIFILSIVLVFGILRPGTQTIKNEDKIEISQFHFTIVKMVSNITLIINYHDGENVTFYNLTLIGDISPYNATVVALGDKNISKYFAINGVFVKGMCITNIWYINGDQNRNWLYYVNGGFPGVSSSILQLNNNSIVEWRFVAGNPFKNDSGPENTFWIYLGIFSGIAVALTAGLILIAKKGVISIK